MGHYASEMDPNWMKGHDEIEAWRKAKFEYPHGEKLECGVCGALVIDWRKHRTVCKKEK